MNLRTSPDYEYVPWKQEGHAIHRLDIHIHWYKSGSATGVDVKVKCANSSCGISKCLSFGGRGRAGICFHTNTHWNCATTFHASFVLHWWGYTCEETRHLCIVRDLLFTGILIKRFRVRMWQCTNNFFWNKNTTSVFSPPLKDAVSCDCLENVRMFGLEVAREMAMSQNVSTPSRHNHRPLTMASNRS